MTVRSEQLSAGVVAGAATWTTVYTVPAWATTIVKEVVLQNAHTGQVDSSCAIWTAGVAYLGPVVRLDAHGSGKVERVERWTVLEAGQLLRLYCSVAAVLYYTISGAELAGT